ncbi:Leucine-rich repeat protein kinase family protein [Rhynchospora pubera]|uniref:Leucine-rich repeat protein kinase family protein n=1 Tax=Rhynchospora pubera TaxID=906938 RepID=A0AAV8FE72_9POAL|nr:Leucine-rich repeat protein kinase family protein [Rhynchospora pubera]
MKTSRDSHLCSPSYLSLSILLFLLPSPLLAINPDIPLLLSFKYSILSDPLSVLSNWGYFDTSPCSWNGVVCMGFPLSSSLTTNATNNTISSISNTTGSSDSSNSWVPTFSRVISIVLPNSQLLGPIASELGLLKHLRHLDLSGNLFNGTLPSTLFDATELRVLSLSNNELSGEVPESVGQLTNLQELNLAGNALTGVVPTNITLLPNLTIVSLSNNYLHGDLPASGFDRLETLDLSSNLLNSTLPAEFSGKNLKYLNLSDNHLTGTIPLELGTTIPPNATVDFSFNNFTGPIPQTGVFLAQKATAFLGNPNLCGAPLENLCTIPSTLSNPPNATDPTTESKSPPAIAAIPNNTSGDSAINGGRSGKHGGIRLLTILAIAAGDLAGIAVLSIVFMYVYHVKKRRRQESDQRELGAVKKGDPQGEASDKPGPSSRGFSCCLRKENKYEDETEETSESSETEAETPKDNNALQQMKNFKSKEKKNNLQPVLITIDGTPELELESLLKASAYILGAAGPNIVYKAVLADGTALAVRRIGENGNSSGVEKLKDFEMQVRAIARIRHPNVLRIRGFYWGPEEKLLIHDYAPNGSLSNISIRKKQGSSPLHLNWNTRMRIAKGIARGLSYIHEKKQVHGNIKPSNILLGFEFEPLIGDFGLERLIRSDLINRQFGSKRSALSLPDLSPSLPASPFAGPSSSLGTTAPYQAPETLKNLKPNSKSDVYSFGVVLLELISGRVFSDVELCQLNSISEQEDRVLKMVDASLRNIVRGKEDAILSFFKLGFSCCAMLPQKRPSMKDAMQVLDRIPYDS